MTHSMRVEILPTKEYLVIKGYGYLYDPGVDSRAADEDTWDGIRGRFADGSVDRLRAAAGSEDIYMLFCHTCVRDDGKRCYVCSYDMACENARGGAGEFASVRLEACEYAAYDCAFDTEKPLRDAHELPDALFWGEGGWLGDSGYTCAIDDPAKWSGKGYAQIERYAPFDLDAKVFQMKIWYPLVKKEV